jgi:hypothetical protein
MVPLAFAPFACFVYLCATQRTIPRSFLVDETKTKSLIETLDRLCLSYLPLELVRSLKPLIYHTTTAGQVAR